MDTTDLKRLFFPVIAALAVAGMACGDSEFSPEALIAQIVLGPGDCAGLRVDESCTLEVTAIDTGGSVVTDPQLVWDSLDKAIATVDFMGTVTGRTPGVARIVATTTDLVISQQIAVNVDENPGPPPDPDL